jgi:hypothetical protein
MDCLYTLVPLWVKSPHELVLLAVVSARELRYHTAHKATVKWLITAMGTPIVQDIGTERMRFPLGIL